MLNLNNQCDYISQTRIFPEDNLWTPKVCLWHFYGWSKGVPIEFPWVDLGGKFSSDFLGNFGRVNFLGNFNLKSIGIK